MKMKRINLLAGSILAASALLPLAYGHAEDDKKWPMPSDIKFDPEPAKKGSLTQEFMVYGVDPKGQEVPLKTIRITNNSDKTIYPIMRDPNDTVATEGSTVGLYNPYDPVNREYRGYIGYKEGDQYYFGLPAGKSILVRIPLAFWNGARMGLGTDGQFMTVGTRENPSTKQIEDVEPNPLRWRNASKKTIAPAEKDTSTDIPEGDKVAEGVVLWYRTTERVSEAPNDDTEDQLVEWTIRDHGYLKNLNNDIADSELVTLINYDVSNVDNLYLPVSMQVFDEWVIGQKNDSKGNTDPKPNRNAWTAGSMPEPNGWTGSIDKIEELQKEIQAFTKTPNEYLGKYFGEEKRGWPYYNMPDAEKEGVARKIPSGANIFAQSPFKDTMTSYKDGVNFQLDRYMLSSGGTDALDVPLSVVNNGSKGDVILIASSEVKEKIQFVKDVFAKGSAEKPSLVVFTNDGGVFAPKTFVKSVEPATENGKETIKIILSKPMLRDPVSVVARIARPKEDYAVDAMIRLWFSWADYYRKNWKKNNASAPTAPVEIKGSIETMSATLEFAEKQEGLVPGMSVDGPGLKDAMTENGMHQGKAVILEVAGDKRSVILSQVARTGQKDVGFTFAPPEELIWTPKAGQPGYGNLNFAFAEKGQPGYEEARDPYLFSQQVYLIMASMNQIGEPNNDSVCKYMQDVIGANMGFIFTVPAQKSEDGKMVTSMIRDMIKSVLRGVVDFTKFPDKMNENNEHVVWYPDPSKETGGQKFNVFNLDPFVWFVHVKLGFSGYGFSVDDDTADIGAGGANHLQVSVAGPKGLRNLNEWSIQARFGPLKGVTGLKYSGPDDKDWAPGTIKSITATVDNMVKINTAGPCNMRDGDLVYIDQVEGITGLDKQTFVVRHAKKESFEIADANDPEKGIPFNGQPAAKGRFGVPMQPYIETGEDLAKVFNRVADDDAMWTFLGTPVTVNISGQGAVSQNKDGVKFRVQRKGGTKNGQLILNTPLTNKDGTPLPAGTNYTFDFTGSSSKAKKE